MEKITIGRDDSCDIVINDSRVSRFHAEIEFDPTGTEMTYYRFYDKSSNGTIVNGKFIKGQSVEVYRKFNRSGVSPIEPQILLAKVVPLSWNVVLNSYSNKYDKYGHLKTPTVVLNSFSNQYPPQYVPENNNQGVQENVTVEKYPDNLNSWNWGAFSFGWIWAISNGIYWPLIEIIPFIGWMASIVVRIILGTNGNRWAWEKKKWEDIDQFKKVQHNWSIAALWFFLGLIVFSFLFFVFVLSFNIMSHQ